MNILNVIAEGVSGGTSTAPDDSALKIAFVSGVVTIIVTVLTVFGTRSSRKRDAENVQPGAVQPMQQDDDRDAEEISDLRRQRDTLQRKYDASLAENRRLQRIMIQHKIDPYEGLNDAG